MTREELYRIVSDAQIYGQDPARTTELILAALAKEREGDKVLAEGELFSCIHEVYGRYYKEIGPDSQRGQLIFRPQRGTDEQGQERGF